MKKVSDVMGGNIKRKIVSMHVGESGSGKTHLAATYPKCYFLITEPASEETWLNVPELRKNIVGFEHFIPSRESLKDMFKNITAEIGIVKDLFEKGEVETLVIDNLTYLVHNRWLWINEFEKKFTVKGEVDIRGMYGDLRTWGFHFMLMELLSFKGNIVVNVHEQLENEDALDKKVDKSITVVPNVIGGLRNDLDGLFSNVFYLYKRAEKVGNQTVYKYYAQTNKGNNRNAKNRLNLPTIIENVSYQTIKDAMDKASEGGK